MTLANKKNQGSAISTLMPWRMWLAEPATIGSGEQLSLLKLVDASDIAGGEPEIPGMEWAVPRHRLHWEVVEE